MYCKNCGKEIQGDVTFCPICGADQRTTSNNSNVNNYNQDMNYGNNNSYNNPRYTNGPGYTTDNGGFGWGLLGFCIPLVGLILYLVWKDGKPYTASAVGKGALISVIIAVVLYLLMFMIGLSSM